jgi:WD40 repeat protein/serine/threonine protein kinase
MIKASCPADEELSAFDRGDLSPAAQDAIAAHLETCPRCEAILQQLEQAPDAMISALRRAPLIEHESTVRNGARWPTLPGYEILGELGRGGMGVVYKARQLGLNRLTAVKMILAGGHAGAEALTRFHAEAEAAAALHHPHIVAVYEVGAQDGCPFFSMEYVAGGSLKDRLQGLPQPAEEAARLVESLARAVSFAHERGIVHRDLKPANILLQKSFTTEDTEERKGAVETSLPLRSSVSSVVKGFTPKITDFGLVKRLDLGQQTQSGQILGTPDYMAPEQAAGKGNRVGPTVDIYSLGAILYELLTGRRPFQAASALETLEQVRQQEPVPPRRVQPQVPRDLDTICLKCLAKEPGKRYASALALAEDLRRFLTDEPIQARPPSLGERCARWVRHHKAVAVAFAAISVTLVAATMISLLAAFQKETERQKATRAQERAEKAQQLAEERRELAVRNLYIAKTNLTGMMLDAPSGIGQVAQLLNEWRGLKASTDPRGWEWFYCQTLASRAQRTLRGHDADASALAWSPDGKWLASGGFDETIRFWDAATGRQLLRVAAPWGITAVSWSPDGRRLATANWSDKSAGLWDPVTGKEVQARLRHSDQVYSVAFRPDGRRLAVGDGGSRVIVWDPLTARSVFTLTGTGNEWNAVCWSPDGRYLATSAAGGAVKIWDGESGKGLGKLEGHTADVSALRWSPDGRRLASADRTLVLKLWDMTSYTELRTLPNSLVESFGSAVCWSPDSRYVAAACHDLAIRVWEADSGKLLWTLWGHTGSHLAAVCWSPDGTRLASAERGWNGEIKMWKLPPEPELRTLTVSKEVEPFLQVCWSPDGHRLATAHKDGTIQIWDVATGQRIATLHGHMGPVRKVSWSPDGCQLASGGDDRTVKLWDVPHGRLLDSVAGRNGGIDDISWSPDGKWLAWDSANSTITLRELATGTLRSASFQGKGVAWSPTGARLAVGVRPYKIRIHDAQTGALVNSWATSVDSDNEPFWSPDGARIASVSDYAVDVREAATGRAPFSPLRHTQRVQALAWSPDNKQLATATEDNQIHLWDAVTGNPILTLRGQAGPIRSVAWSPDGMQLAFASARGTIHIWDATRGYQIERAAALLPELGSRITAQTSDQEALRLRAGVYARLGHWNQAAADVESLGKLTPEARPRFFQAGWWIADASGPDSAEFDPRCRDPFGIDSYRSLPHGSAPDVIRWYLSADDPNGYVPLAKDEPYYLTRVYALREQQVELELDRPTQIRASLWINGAPVPEPHPRMVTLTPGWNTLVVRIEDGTPPSNVLFHPRAGFYWRLHAQKDAERPPAK